MPAPRKTTALKRLQGTARADRVPKVDYARRLDQPPPAPATLAAAAVLHWNRIAAATVGLGVLTEADLSLLELLSNTLAAEAEARTALTRDGLTTAAGSGGTKKHPAAAVAETARSQALAMMREFGLTPRARQSVDRAPASGVNPFSRDGEASPWAEFETAREPLADCHDTDTDTPRPTQRRQGALQ